ncbi:MAG: MFS transporter [Gammaproteobacteria bacterium]
MTASNSGQPYPSRRYAWYSVALLTVAYIFSFVDRYILSLLVEPIKQDLGLSDTEIGLLLGTAFALFFAVMGLPLGWLADRGRRTWIVGTGVALWSLATAVSGLARSFVQLFLARIGVGVGEASLAPCALSLISDSFPESKRGRPISFYTAAQSLGAGIAFVGGGAVFAWASSAASIDIPGLGALKPWQFTFFAVGLPGLLVALPLFLLREPPRQERLSDDAPSMRAALTHVGTRWKTYAAFVAFPTVMTIVAYSQNWYAAMFQRTWAWDIATFATYFGIALLVIGPVTVNTAGWLCDRLSSRGVSDGPVKVMLGGSLLLVPTGILAPLMPSGELAFAVLLINLVGQSTVSAAAPIALLNITPGEIRGQISALFYMIIAPVGLVIGPLAVGILNDFVFGEAGIRYSAAWVALVFGAPLIVIAGFCRRSYSLEYDALRSRS